MDEIEELKQVIIDMYLSEFNQHDAQRLAESLIAKGYGKHPQGLKALIVKDVLEVLKREYEKAIGPDGIGYEPALMTYAEVICREFAQPSAKECKCYINSEDVARTVRLRYECPRCGGTVGKKEIQPSADELIDCLKELIAIPIVCNIGDWERAVKRAEKLIIKYKKEE